MAFVALVTDQAGVFWADIADIVYVQDDIATPGFAFVGLAAGGASRTRVVGTGAAVAAAIHTASGVVVVGYPTAPMVDYVKVSDGAHVWFQADGASSLLDVDATGLHTLVNTRGPEAPWLMLGDPTSIGPDLAAAAGTSGGGGGSGLGAFWVGLLDGTTGAILAEKSDISMTAAPTAPYVPGSGSYAFTFSGAPIPVTMTFLLTPIDIPNGYPIAARQTAPGAATWVMGTVQPNNCATANIDATGGVAGQGVTCIRNAAGDYTVTMVDTPIGAETPGQATMADAAGPFLILECNQTAPGVWHVEIRDIAGVATDSDFTFTAWNDASGSGRMNVPVEGFWTIAAIDMVP